MTRVNSLDLGAAKVSFLPCDLELHSPHGVPVRLPPPFLEVRTASSTHGGRFVRPLRSIGQNGSTLVRPSTSGSEKKGR